MNVKKRTEIIIKWIDNYCKSMPFTPKALVVGVSGGIDSSVVSTLSAMTGRKTIVLSMPIKQIKSQHDLSLKHGKWLSSKFKNVEYNLIELENLFNTTDRNYLISEGQIIAEGTKRELLENSEAVKSYFGTGFANK